MKRFSLFAVLLCTLQAFCCTTFVMEGDGRIYLGRNLDWDWDDGIVLVNQRNVQKRAFVLFGKPVTWTSIHGSVTFNQFGRELPFGGMNEAGLVVENMWLDDTQYPAADERPEINMLQWIQYQLDNHSTVKEVIESDKKIRMENTPIRARIHYLVCDAKGDTATIEFVNGKARIHQGKDLDYAALANDTYEKSIEAFQTDAAGRDLSRPLINKSSTSRFCRAIVRAKAFKPAKDTAQDVRYSFETLKQVDQGDYTVWQIVYDISRRQIHFRTRKNMTERAVDLKALGYDCKQPLQFADIHSKASASGVIEFKPFVDEDHRKFVRKFFAQDSMKQTVGDLTPLVEPFLSTVGSYKCGE